MPRILVHVATNVFWYILGNQLSGSAAFKFLLCLKQKKTRGKGWGASHLRPAGSDPEVVCQKDSFLKVSVSLGGFGPSVAHGKHSVRRRCVQATKKQGRNLLSP